MNSLNRLPLRSLVRVIRPQLAVVFTVRPRYYSGNTNCGQGMTVRRNSVRDAQRGRYERLYGNYSVALTHDMAAPVQPSSATPNGFSSAVPPSFLYRK